MQAIFSVPTSVRVGSAKATPRRPFIPHTPLTLRTAVWVPLLGMALVSPLMLLSSLTPVSEHSRSAFASVAMAPAMGFLKHVLIGPLLEEVVYRGLLLQLARRYLPTWLAIGLSAVLFGVMHFPGGPALVVSAALMGVLFGWMAVRARSVYASILCHTAFNFSVGFIIAPLFDIARKLQAVPMGGRITSPLTLMPMWWIALSSAIATLAVVMFMRETRRVDPTAIVSPA